MANKIKTKAVIEPRKSATKIKVSKPATKTTSAEVEAATKFAKDFAIRKGLISGENTTTGGVVPKFIDSRTGKESAPSGTVAPVGMLSNKVPSEIKNLEWDSESNLPYYIDPQTGDSKYVSAELFNLSRFKKATPLSSMTTSIAKR